MLTFNVILLHYGMTKSNFASVPRIESLHHRLLNAKAPDGEPLPLLDELMVFLEDPPPDTGDRWQAGADLCAAHGIAASRMAVWRMYRTHVIAWRGENAPTAVKIPQKATELLLDQNRHLIAARTAENLHDPRLSPGILVGLIQGENQRQEIQLARDKFNEQLATKRKLEHQERVRQIEEAHFNRAMNPYLNNPQRDLIAFIARTMAAGDHAPDLYPTGGENPVTADNTP
jgi:hypothetical protein